MPMNRRLDTGGHIIEGSMQLLDDMVRYSEDGETIEYRFEVMDRKALGLQLQIYYQEGGTERREKVFISFAGNRIQIRRGPRTLHAKKLARQISEEQKHDLLSPMPGFIRKIFVSVGDTVQKGDRLATLEAMKMEHTLFAPFNGRVERIFFAEGDRVGQDEIVVKIA